MPHTGVPGLLIMLVIVILVSGAGRLPEVGCGLGKGIREFRKSVSEAGEPTRPGEAMQ